MEWQKGSVVEEEKLGDRSVVRRLARRKGRVLCCLSRVW